MSSGKIAEEKAARFLKANKFKILAVNWKRRLVEIDIIARKRKIIYFVEVKYRKSANWGAGIEFIDKNKIAQLKLGAELWSQENKYDGSLELLAVEVSGDEYVVSRVEPIET